MRSGPGLYTRVSERYPWICSYFGADAGIGIKGNQAYEGRGMMTELPRGSDFLVRFFLNITKASVRGSWYAPNMEACWDAVTRKACRPYGNTNTMVHQQVLLDYAGGSHGGPPFHILRDGTRVPRTDPRYPVDAYSYYCCPCESCQECALHAVECCDPYSNSNGQSIYKLAPHLEWAHWGFPAHASDGWVGNPKLHELNVGGLFSQIWFACMTTEPVELITVNIGPETGLGGLGKGRETEFVVSDFDVLVPLLPPTGQRTPPLTGMGPRGADAPIPEARQALSISVQIDRNVVHTTDPLFVSVTMDTGSLASGYAGADLEATDMITLARSLGPAYLRLSGGAADGLGYRLDTSPPPLEGQPEKPSLRASGLRPASVGQCVGADCGNCDLANTPAGPPAVVIAPPGAWFNLTSWRRINSFAAATNLQIIFGLNSKARETTDAAWDGRYGMGELIEWTASQPLSQVPVVAYELSNEPDLFCRGNSTILPRRLAADVIALRDRLSAVGKAHGKSYRVFGPDTAGIGDHITNSTTGNPEAIYNHFFSQFATNLSHLLGRTSRIPAGGKVLDELTFHQCVRHPNMLVIAPTALARVVDWTKCLS